METNYNRLPKVDIYGKEIPKDSIFFKIPEKIGTILFASTSFSEGQRPLTQKELVIKFIKWSGILLAIAGVIIFIGKITYPLGIIILLGLPLLIALWIVNKAKKFQHACWYIGDNGFSVVHFIDSMDNATGFEFCFDNVTDLFTTRTAQYVNGGYTRTDYSFLWINNKNPIYTIENKYENEHNDPDKFPFLYHFMSLAEKQWTNKLITQIPQTLQENGFLSFIYVTKDGRLKINLSSDFIEYSTINDENKYRVQLTEIEKIHSQKGALIMTLKEPLQKKYLFGLIAKSKEQQIGISLSYLSNQKYFLYAVQTLWNLKNVDEDEK